MVRATSSNRDSGGYKSECFTVAQATEMLPLVSMIVSDALQLNRAIERQRQQIRGIDAIAGTIDHPSYQDELKDIRGSLLEDEKRLKKCLGELSQLGVEPHLPLSGAVDFPSIINRQPAVLCWFFGEPSVDFWHEVGAVNAERKPLPLELLSKRLPC